MHGFIPSCNNKISIWKTPLTMYTMCEKRTKFFWLFNGFKQFSIVLGSRGGPWKGHHHCDHSLARTPDPMLPRTGHSPAKVEELDIHSLLPPPLWLITTAPHSASPNTLSHLTLQACPCQSPFSLPCLLCELCFSCFCVPHNLFLMQDADFSPGPFPCHPPLLPPGCTDVRAWAASLCSCLMLPPTHWSFTNIFQQWVTGLSLGCLDRTDFIFLSFMLKKMEIWIPCRVQCLLFRVLLSVSWQPVLCLAVLADLGLRIMGVFIVHALLMYR